MKILTLPGYLGSDEEHWQSYWEQELDNISRVEQADWESPKLNVWLDALNTVIQNSDEPTILVAHSLACSLVNHWANTYESNKVCGALFVAPADVDSAKHTPEIIRNFAPMPLNKLKFPSIVISSNNDPYVALERAEFFADAWGSQLLNVGALGHINSESNLKSWEEGKRFLEELDYKS